MLPVFLSLQCRPGLHIKPRAVLLHCLVWCLSMYEWQTLCLSVRPFVFNLPQWHHQRQSGAKMAYRPAGSVNTMWPEWALAECLFLLNLQLVLFIDTSVKKLASQKLALFKKQEIGSVYCLVRINFQSKRKRKLFTNCRRTLNLLKVKCKSRVNWFFWPLRGSGRSYKHNIDT